MNKSDFAIYKKGNDIFSMGFKFDNLLMQKDLPAMVGGGSHTIHNSNYGLPVGLALLTKKHDIHSNNEILNRNIEGGVISDDLYTKLLNLAEANSKKKKRTNTRKKRNKNKSKKKKKNKTKKYK